MQRQLSFFLNWEKWLISKRIKITFFKENIVNCKLKITMYKKILKK